MGKITVERNVGGIEGLCVITPTVYKDARGYSMEIYSQRDFEEEGLSVKFVQDNQSCSTKGVLRGLHFQKKYPQGKLVRALYGSVYDVAVDLRASSKSFGKWYGLVLSDENNKMFYVPEGFAHGFLVLSDVAHFSYKCTNFYHPEDEGGLLWNDEILQISWPILQ
ncbi:MAG: dTDP-4-dehydrorhamnose 3,5-epimerase, partial [Lachnospiraceae bacterium]|nr:dTDP-4-dehydrorhamnose 3,5-epimerase [Lachnospiraceae bacterium]